MVSFNELEEYVWGRRRYKYHEHASLGPLHLHEKKLPEGAILMIKEVGYRLGSYDRFR